MTYLKEAVPNLNGRGQDIAATCKYLSDNDRVIEGLFRDKVIRFSQPWVLNDSVEVNPSLNLTFGERETNYTHFIYNGVRLPSYKDQVYISLVESRYNRYGILSLSKELFSYDMWNLYANAHKGFIIDFKQELDEKACFRSIGLFSGLVKYVEKYEIVVDRPISEKGFATYDYLNEELFLTKTIHWKIEREYRIVRPLAEYPHYVEPVEKKSYRDKKLYLFDYDPSAITTIIFGAAMDRSTKRKILDLTDKLNITYFQCLIDKSDDFALYYLPISAWESRENFLTLSHQVFFTDDLDFKYRNLEKAVTDLHEIPYYRDHPIQEMVLDFIRRKEVKQKKGL